MKLDIALGSERSLGPIVLGMTRADVRHALGPRFKEFKRTAAVESPSEFYSDDGVFVYYKPADTVEAVEVAAPSEVWFKNLDLLNEPYEDVIRLLRCLDEELAVDEDGAVSKKLGIGIFAPEAVTDRKCRVESVIVFEEGYYEGGS